MLTLVDTSVWIDLLSKKPRHKLGTDDLLRIATCNPIIQEIFQGLREGEAKSIITQQFLYLPRLLDPIPLECFLQAADIFSVARRKGFTVRSSIDCLIAAIAIKCEVPVWHNDRDFDVIARFTRLQTAGKVVV